jgi:peptide/nickel transport system permease protein
MQAQRCLYEAVWLPLVAPSNSRNHYTYDTTRLQPSAILIPLRTRLFPLSFVEIFNRRELSITITWMQSLRFQPLAIFGIILLTIFVVLAIFAPWIAPFDPAAIHLHARLQSPSATHWFGTDELGRDILSRVVYGTRISLFVATSVVSIALFFGVIFGSIAGFYGGWLDAFLNVLVMNTFMALPGILIAIALVAFLGPGMTNLILALSITGWVGYARLVRAQVLAVREREFVEAARAMGASNLRILTRHILPNIIQPVMVQAAIGMAGTILAEATLSFLGLGVPPPMPSWGVMLNDARAHLFDAPHMVIFPAIAIMLAVLSFNFIGDSLRDQLDPRTRVAVGVGANY